MAVEREIQLTVIFIQIVRVRLEVAVKRSERAEIILLKCRVFFGAF